MVKNAEHTVCIDDMV